MKFIANHTEDFDFPVVAYMVPFWFLLQTFAYEGVIFLLLFVECDSVYETSEGYLNAMVLV